MIQKRILDDDCTIDITLVAKISTQIHYDLFLDSFDNIPALLF
jgi:hypothetical protein